MGMLGCHWLSWYQTRINDKGVKTKVARELKRFVMYDIRFIKLESYIVHPISYIVHFLVTFAKLWKI
jgi:hypothetical protein